MSTSNDVRILVASLGNGCAAQIIVSDLRDLAFAFSVMIVWLKVGEESNLERRFGQAYRDYKRQAPFLVPRFKALIVDLATLLLRRITEAEETSL